MKAFAPAWRVAPLLLATFLFPALHGRVVGRLHVMTQATVKIEVTGGPIIYIDPTGINTTPADADLILLTHNHSDHQSAAVLGRLRKAGTVFVSSPPGVPALQQSFTGAAIQAVTPGEKLTVAGVEIETVPAYNIVKNNHPRVMNFVGYVLNIGGVRVYHAGDTERIPEMRTFSAEVALLPLGQTFTMTSVQEAIDATLDVKPRIAIPIHWGNAEGTRADAEFYVSQLSSRMQAMVNTPPEGLALEVSETIAITEHPASVTVAPGGNATLSVQATGSGALRYQWRRNGLAVPGATTSSLAVAGAAVANEGDYEVIIADANGPITSRMARLLVAPPVRGRLVNVSVRGPSRGAGSPLIVGFVVAGGAQSTLVRGIGPGLTAFGVTNALADPRLDLHATVNGQDTIVASNNDWGAGGAAGLRAAFAATGAFDLADITSRDAAVLVSIDGARTVHVADTAGRSGVALVEVYDADATGEARLVNLSARNFVGAGDEAFIAGFVISGNMPKRVLIRGLGPRLASFGVTGALADPKMDLFVSRAGGGSVRFAANDNWAEETVAPLRAAFAAAGTFDFPDVGSKDAALLATVPAGAFTVQLSGSGGSTGEAMVELYELPD